jgi:hypothetical protein
MENVLSRTALMEHILSLVENPDSHVQDLGAILEWDPSLSRSVTRKAAVSYGLPIPACTLNLALALLGSRIVKETVRYAITSRAAHDLVISVYETDGFWNRVASAEHEPGPAPEIHCGALREQLEAGLGLLTPEMRVILALHYYESLPLEMIARVTAMSVEEVEHLKDQALCRLSTVFGQPHTDQTEGSRQ